MNHHHWPGLVLALLLAPSLAWAGDFICGYDVVSATKESLHRFTESSDATKVPPCPAPYTKYGVPETPPTLIQEQRDLYERVKNKKHIKVVDGLMVEMADAEKALVDAPGKAQDAATDVAKQEVNSNAICAKNTLTEITEYWMGAGPESKQSELKAVLQALDGKIAALNAGPVKDAFLADRAAHFAHMTMLIENMNLIWRYMCSRTFIAPVP